MKLLCIPLLLLLTLSLVSCSQTSSAALLSPGQTATAVVFVPPTGNNIPSMGITYSTPNFPPVISKAQAIQIALNSTLMAGTGANSTTKTYARYVIIHQQNALSNGQPVPNFPAWVITFEGVNVYGHGRGSHVNHELYVVVNAQTGEAVFSFSYR